MDELELVRLHEDGERLVLTAHNGTQSTLPITDALRAAIRGDRPRLESIRAQEGSALRPREIQTRLRAGETCEQLAEASGLPVEHVQRFEYPVLTERAHAITRVRAKAVLTDDDTTATLGEVTDERLLSRGVQPDSTQWSATRQGNQPWFVKVEFEAAERPRQACWSLEPRSGLVTALDDEARWLGLPEDSTNGPTVVGIATAPSPQRDQDSPHSVPDTQDDTDLLLDNLSERRGRRPARRPALDIAPPEMLEPVDLDSSPNGFSEPATQNAAIVDLGARRGDSRPTTPPVHMPDSPKPHDEETPHPWDTADHMAEDGDTEPPHTPITPSTDESATEQAGTTVNHPTPQADSGTRPETHPKKLPADPSIAERSAPKRGRKSRVQVPSWDDIMFGSRPEL